MLKPLHFPWLSRFFRRGTNTDLRGEMKPADTASEVQNMRPFGVDGNAGALVKIGGEVLEFRSSEPGAATYVCVGAVEVGVNVVAFWASSDPANYDPIIKVNATTMARHPDIPYTFDHMMQMPMTLQDGCETGLIYPVDGNAPFLFWDVQDIIDNFNSGSVKYFSGFVITSQFVNPTVPANFPKFIGLKDVGAPPTYNGVSVGFVCHIAANGSLITTEQWSPTGIGFNGGALRSAIAPDGSVVFNGNAYFAYNGTTVRPSTENTAIRVAADGTLIGIIAQGRQFEEFTSPTSAEFVIQPDGQIIFVGSFIKYDSVLANRIVRTNAAGATDLTFRTNSGTGFDVQTLGVDVLPNGWIMVGSNVPATYNGVATGGLTRLQADGTLEPTWNLGTGFNAAVYIVIVDSFGDLIVGGNFTQLDGTSYNYVVKL